MDARILGRGLKSLRGASRLNSWAASRCLTYRQNPHARFFSAGSVRLQGTNKTLFKSSLTTLDVKKYTEQHEWIRLGDDKIGEFLSVSAAGELIGNSRCRNLPLCARIARRRRI